jgi:hypothetical protein
VRLSADGASRISGQNQHLQAPVGVGGSSAAQGRKQTMARPQTAYTAKPGKQKNTGPDKMRMSHDRLRRDIKRIEVEQARMAAAEAPKRGRK